MHKKWYLYLCNCYKRIVIVLKYRGTKLGTMLYKRR